MKKIFDLRSDTVTVPCKNMRKAMYDAKVGDDIMREDPTVRALEDYVSEITGKEASLFLPSGTMGNLIPCIIFGGKGNYAILERECHIIRYELGGIASLASLMPVTVTAKHGILTKDIIKDHVNVNPPYDMPKISMIALENTHNRAGGTVYPIGVLKELYKYANDKKVHVHMDGARVFNAAAASGVSVKEIAGNTDSLTFCFSKGLGSPAGSILCGTKSFINEALIIRKTLGGAMRQSGILAAACIYALKNNVKRLSDDHKHAKMIAGVLNNSYIGKVDMESVQTNIVIIETTKKSDIVLRALLKNGIKGSFFGDYNVRLVLHKDVSQGDVKNICAILSKCKA